jgi:predicted DNA-binding protein
VLIARLRRLAKNLGKRQNELVEEAIRDLLEKGVRRMC